MNNPTSRILIVDDDLIARESLSELLMIDGYEVTTIPDGTQVIEALVTFQPDLILLDVMMPHIDGFTVCRQLKNDPNWQHIPVILLTALDTTDDLVQGLNAGADEFLSKPVDRAELRARIRTMIRIKQQYDKLQEAMSLREELANMVVHDMRSSLMVILMHSGLVLSDEDDLPPLCLKSIQTIQSQARQLNAFTNNLLTLAKKESGYLHLSYKEINDISQLIEPLKENYTLFANLINATLVFNIPKQPYPILLDPTLFIRILDNLISNAIKFSPRNSTITLSVLYPRQKNKNAPHIQICIADEGPGIPETHRESIFDKYSIVESKQSGIRQTGLGLAFCKMAVEAHKGHITVSDNKPQGAIFLIEI